MRSADVPVLSDLQEALATPELAPVLEQVLAGGPSGNAGASTGFNPASEPSADGAAYCRFHTQWGTAAHRCIKPCAWPGNLQAAGKN